MHAGQQSDFAGDGTYLVGLASVRADLLLDDKRAYLLLDCFLGSLGQFAYLIWEAGQQTGDDVLFEFIYGAFARRLVRVLNGRADFTGHLIADGLKDVF